MHINPGRHTGIPEFERASWEAKGNEEMARYYEDRIVMLKDAARLAKETGLSEARVEESLMAQQKLSRETEDLRKQAAAVDEAKRKAPGLAQTQKELEIATLRSRGRNRQADKLQESLDMETDVVRFTEAGASPAMAREVYRLLFPFMQNPICQQRLASEDATTPTKKAGKIYAYRNYVFQNELIEGIHIIDNADPAQPLKGAIFNSGSTQLLFYACQRSGRTRFAGSERWRWIFQGRGDRGRGEAESDKRERDAGLRPRWFRET